MTELTISKSVFLKTVEAFRGQFKVEEPQATLESEASRERFILTAKSATGDAVKAFGACEMKGDPFSVAFDLPELELSVIDAYAGSESDSLTLIIANGIFVKDPGEQV